MPELIMISGITGQRQIFTQSEVKTYFIIKCTPLPSNIQLLPTYPLTYIKHKCCNAVSSTHQISWNSILKLISLSNIQHSITITLHSIYNQHSNHILNMHKHQYNFDLSKRMWQQSNSDYNKNNSWIGYSQPGYKSSNLIFLINKHG